MTVVGRLFLALLLLAGIAQPACADDIAAAGRSVVRVVTIAVVDGQVVGFGHGSGYAVAPDRIVTNAHVVELANRYPDNVVVGIVPSEGDRSFQGRLVAYDPRADLALVEVGGLKLPPATLYAGAAGDGGPVVALGYPGNVDLAVARSAADYIKPTLPVRSEGVFSGRRTLTGIEVLLHTASIARGNSGGPLLDRCGRVIGTNSAITRGEEGDSTFGFAIADTELTRFLRQADQPFLSVAAPCTPIEERLRADAGDEARSKVAAAETRRLAADAAARSRDAALADARAAAQTMRENVMAVAGLMLVAGALAVGGAGLLELKGRREPAIWTAVGGAAAIVAAIVVFVLRPTAAVTLPPQAAAAPAAAADIAAGCLVCTFDADRSRLTVSTPADVTLEWGGRGCVDGRTQYVERGGRWERILAPQGEQTVSVASFDPVTGRYAATRYFLPQAAMAAVREARGTAANACSTRPDTLARLAERQDAMRALLPPLPNEKLVYACRREGR